MKKLNNNYEAPKAEWVELFAENEVMQTGGNLSKDIISEPSTEP